MAGLEESLLTLSKYVLVIVSMALLLRCIRSLLHEQVEPEIWV